MVKPIPAHHQKKHLVWASEKVPIQKSTHNNKVVEEPVASYFEAVNTADAQAQVVKA